MRWDPQDQRGTCRCLSSEGTEAKARTEPGGSQAAPPVPIHSRKQLAAPKICSIKNIFMWKCH